MNSLLTARDIYKSYHDGERELRVLRGASLSVARGEAVAVVGMSGAGKSTLLHLLGGLDVPDRGEIAVDGETISGRSLTFLHEFRNRKIGYVFQFHHLLPEFTALENVMMPALIAGGQRKTVAGEARQMLERLGLADRERHRPSKLSGGEQQRIALARALMNQPALLLADEPTGNLDLHTGDVVINLMWEMTVKQGRGLVIVTHEPLIAARADRVLRLHEGTLLEVARNEIEAQMAQGPGAKP
ncbi:MAG TPA: ABC transporter ATP-binding protein [Candidatus Sumerlaeota bacterium]|nr:MAG: Lipoprotein-releasing system ATP-binding protein LolD [candidate division BRC1 bacterium ADurb.BinA292]HOE95599.1 ABC transporter ATP-binding protein [Candidatus Sumerlaeota bacterium]HOR28754.1 ABC transporter ATP-binding protein [Candidatus Sumerlaeota bacterium]HPK02314.1 ABC transporter ATP-binding protein [Candidatus Sumerlaeota bacterium]